MICEYRFITLRKYLAMGKRQKRITPYAAGKRHALIYNY